MLICAEMSGIVTIGASSRPQRERGPDLTPSPKSPKVGAAIPSMNCDIRWAASIFHARMLLMPRDGAIIFADLIATDAIVCRERRPVFVEFLACALLARETACQSLTGRLASRNRGCGPAACGYIPAWDAAVGYGGTGPTRRGVGWTKRDAERGNGRNGNNWSLQHKDSPK
jgi:hypothetical protein